MKPASVQKSSQQASARDIGQATVSKIPAGYKMTTLGILPNDWGVDTVINQSDVVTGGKNTQDKLEDGLYPFFVRSQIIEKINSFSFDGESVLTAGDGVGTGKVFHYINGKYDFHQRVYAIREFSNLLHGKYFFYYFSRNFYDRIMSLTAKSSVDSVRREMIAGMKIPLPAYAEQKAIAEALSDIDDLIAAQEELIAKKRDIKQATMQQLLTGRTRLPGFKSKWKKINMLTDATLKARIGWQGLTTEEYLKTGDYMLVTGTDFDGGKINWSSCWYVDKHRYIQDANIQLRLGDVLLTKDGTIGKAGYIDTLPMPATLNSGVFVIRPIGNAFNPQFFFYILTSRVFDDFLNRLQAGSTIVHLYQKDFVTFHFMAPSEMEEQEAIASVLSDMDAEISMLETELEKTKAIKQGMMQELLTGRIRLI